MTLTDFLLFTALEIIFLVGVFLLFVAIRRRREKGAFQAAARVEPELTVDHYVQLLQAQILATESRLKQLEQGGAEEALQAAAVRARLDLLKGERKVVDGSGVDEQKLWSSVSAVFADWVPDEALAEPGTDEAPASTAMVAALQQKLAASRQRIANLEQFRDNFFDIKLRMEAGQVLNQRLHDEIDKSVPREEQSPELRSAMDELKSENETLMQQLQHIQQEFSEIIEDLGEQESGLSADVGVSGLANMEQIKGDLDGSFENLDEGVEQIRQVIVVQEQRIQELHGMVEGLQLEVGDKQRLQACIDELNDKSRELTDVIAVMEEENTFLQEQISALLQQELIKEQEAKAELAQHQQQLEEHVRSSAELEKKYADMEQKYLDLYSECQGGKG